MIKEGFCDCYFEYDKKYDHGQRGGEPDELIFVIYRTKDKMNVQLQEMTQTQRRQFQQYLVQYFDFTPVNAQQMADRITAETYQEAVQKLMSLRDRFASSFVKDKAAYTFKSLDDLLKSKEIPNTVVEEVQ